MTMSELRSAWGAQIRRSRLNAAVSRAALAQEVGVSPGTIRAWESGRCGPGLVARRRVCAALGIPPYLLDALADTCEACGRPWHI